MSNSEHGPEVGGTLVFGVYSASKTSDLRAKPTPGFDPDEE